jgi:hypothetical protein
MIEESRCFAIAENLLGLLGLGAKSAMPHIETINRLINEHAELYVKLYPDQVRPKFHHLFHIIDNMKSLKALISCFVLERKHIVTKDAAHYCYRHIEHTVIVDLINRHCARATSAESPLREMFLIDGHESENERVSTSLAAVMRIARSSQQRCCILAR